MRYILQITSNTFFILSYPRQETSAAAAAAETTNGVGGATPLKAVEDGVEMVWIVDPIDGTTNFVHGFPVTCVSIALATRGEVIFRFFFVSPLFLFFFNLILLKKNQRK